MLDGLRQRGVESVSERKGEIEPVTEKRDQRPGTEQSAHTAEMAETAETAAISEKERQAKKGNLQTEEDLALAQKPALLLRGLAAAAADTRAALALFHEGHALHEDA